MHTEDGKDEIETPFPRPLLREMRVMGAHFNTFMALGGHFAVMIRRARVRFVGVARLTCAKWGLETGVIRMTRSEVASSLLRYGQAVVSRCPPSDLMAKMETHVTNVAARRIGGMDKSTRIQTLHFLAAT